jgi:hypothetical protein
MALPGLPPAAVRALTSPPAGRYVYNMPVYQSDSPLAVPQRLQRVINWEPVDFVLPPIVFNQPPFTELSPSSHTPPPTTPTLTSPLSPPIPVFSPPTPVAAEPLVFALEDARYTYTSGQRRAARLIPAW